jgi:hypothetical protein
MRKEGEESLQKEQGELLRSEVSPATKRKTTGSCSYTYTRCFGEHIAAADLQVGGIPRYKRSSYPNKSKVR